MKYIYISKENICTTLSLYFSKWRFRQNQKFTQAFMYKIGFVLSHFFFYPKKTLIIILIFLCTTKSEDAYSCFLKFCKLYGKLEKWRISSTYIYFCVPILKMIHPSLLIFSLIFCILHSMHLQNKKNFQ